MKDIYSPLEIDEEWDQRAPQMGGPDGAAVAVAGETSAPAEVGVAGPDKTSADTPDTPPAAFGDAQPLEIHDIQGGSTLQPPAPADSGSEALTTEPAAQPEVHTDTLTDTSAPSPDAAPVDVTSDITTQPATEAVAPSEVPSETAAISTEAPMPDEAPVAEVPDAPTDAEGAEATDLPAPPAPDTTFQPQAKPEYERGNVDDAAEAGATSPLDPEPTSEPLDVAGDEKAKVEDAEAAADGKEDAETGGLKVSPVDHAEESAAADAEPTEAPAEIAPEPVDTEEPSAEFGEDQDLASRIDAIRSKLDEELEELRQVKEDLLAQRKKHEEELEAEKKRHEEAQAAVNQAIADTDDQVKTVDDELARYGSGAADTSTEKKKAA